MTRYYTTGAFAKRAHVTVRTLRWYDAQNLLRPARKDDNGRRYYTDADMVKLQQILLFKYLGFSLDEIREMTLASADSHFLLESMRIQQKLVEERIEEMKAVSTSLAETIDDLDAGRPLDYQRMLSAVHAAVMDDSLRKQYEDDANINARIRLHHDYSVNPEGWYHWLYRQYDIHPGMKILEVGCGSGTLWSENIDRVPRDTEVVLSDKSEGMLRDVRRICSTHPGFHPMRFDCAEIPFDENTFDLVIANHVLFYCEDLNRVFAEISRVMKKGAVFAASTYSENHMKEIRTLAEGFNEEIRLSREPLYEKFGLANGRDLLSPWFSDIEERRYEDAIETKDAECLISYILSCHGNQNQLLVDHYREFRDYVIANTKDGFHITKDAGIFLCKKK